MTENEALKIFENEVTILDCLIEHYKDIIADCDTEDDEFDDNEKLAKLSSNDHAARKELFETAISALKEVQQYREIGTIEQVKNQKENLNVAYQIISDYEQYGTIEDFKTAQRYMHLVKLHGTIGQVIDSCAAYEKIGTVEECRKAVEKQKDDK